MEISYCREKLDIMAKTYGEKPIIFAFEENGEQYMIGSEVTITVEHFCQVGHLNLS